MKAGVVIFPGSNCDYDIISALKIFDFDIKILWHKDKNLKNCDIIFLPGGFSYGDYLRGGAIARFSPIMEEIINFANKGKPVIGICNGFQILCEANLLPGTLLVNNNSRFICKNVYIKVINNNTLITKKIHENMILKIPIAHSQGKYFVDSSTLSEMYKNEQVIFKYCDNFGNITENSNPNGSIDNIAGICNKEKNVFGMMPHPERAVFDFLFNTDGKLIFESIIFYLK